LSELSLVRTTVVQFGSTVSNNVDITVNRLSTSPPAAFGERRNRLKKQSKVRFLISALITGFALLALPGQAQAADVEPTACTWGPGRPYTWSSPNTGYIRAALRVSGCSVDDDWNGQLQRRFGVIWLDVDSAEWRGNVGQLLQWDCPDGNNYTVRARMEDEETGSVQFSAVVLLHCP
jgi:hypothetical protein